MGSTHTSGFHRTSKHPVVPVPYLSHFPSGGFEHLLFAQRVEPSPHIGVVTVHTDAVGGVVGDALEETLGLKLGVFEGLAVGSTEEDALGRLKLGEFV